MAWSQNNEEEVILEYFKEKTGRFLDVGAYNAQTFSNTFALVERGWSGVSIEPSPTVFNAAVKNCEAYPSVDLVNAALAVERGLIQFYDSNGDAVSSTSIEHTQKWHMVNFKKFYVNTVTIEDILTKFGEHFDMVSLDVEGTNLELLRTLPLERMGTRLIVIEHDNKWNEMLEYCQGFHEIHRNGENIILAK